MNKSSIHTAVSTSNNSSRKLAFTVYDNVSSKTPRRSTSVELTKLDHLFSPRAIRKDKDGLAYSFVRLKPETTRANANVEHLSAAVFDIDDGTPLDTILPGIRHLDFLAYSTHSHITARPKYRLIFPLIRNVYPSEWPLLWDAINNIIGQHADKNAKDVARLYYFPSCPAGRKTEAFSLHNSGQWLDPDNIPNPSATEKNTSAASLNADLIAGLDALASPPADCGRALDHPASATYDEFSPEQIKALCEIATPVNQMFRKMPPWETQNPGLRMFYRLKAYWTVRGASDPGMAASFHGDLLLPPPVYDPAWAAECKARGWRHPPKNLRELEERVLPPAIPNALRIIDRCIQMSRIRELRGDVSEPYWWAALSITEHASPNLSRECSDGYPGFSEAELAERVARIHREETKPALCSRLNDVNPNLCVLCKYRGSIRSPMALGYEREPKIKGSWHG